MTPDWLFAGAAAVRDGYGSGMTGGTTAALGKSLVVAEINRKPVTPMERSEYRRMAALEGTMWWFRALHARLLDQIGRAGLAPEIGRASCRERVCQYV